MKKIDYKRLEKALSHYEIIKELLSDVVDSLENSPKEFITNRPDAQSTRDLVLEMYNAAQQEAVWLKGKINAFKDLI